MNDAGLCIDAVILFIAITSTTSVFPSAAVFTVITVHNSQAVAYIILLCLSVCCLSQSKLCKCMYGIANRMLLERFYQQSVNF